MEGFDAEPSSSAGSLSFSLPQVSLASLGTHISPLQGLLLLIRGNSVTRHQRCVRDFLRATSWERVLWQRRAWRWTSGVFSHQGRYGSLPSTLHELLASASPSIQSRGQAAGLNTLRCFLWFLPYLPWLLTCIEMTTATNWAVSKSCSEVFWDKWWFP